MILCDLRMPALDGPTFYTLVQQQDPALCQRMIFVTGDTLGVESTAFLAHCGQPYLHKPCTAAAVRHAIHQVLGAVAATDRAFLAPCGQPWLRKPFAFAVLRRVLAQMLGEGPPAPRAPGP